MYVKQLLLVLVSAWLVAGQRGSFAGTEPIGYPALTDAKKPDGLGNRFGEDLPLPLEANGDRDLVDRISKMPVDKQPFWYINWKALEAQRKKPQTYEQKPNVFLSGSNSENNSGAGANNVNRQASQGSQGSQGSGLTSKFGDSSDSNQNQYPNNQPNNYRGFRGSRHY